MHFRSGTCAKKCNTKTSITGNNNNKVNKATAAVVVMFKYLLF